MRVALPEVESSAVVAIPPQLRDSGRGEGRDSGGEARRSGDESPLIPSPGLGAVTTVVEKGVAFRVRKCEAHRHRVTRDTIRECRKRRGGCRIMAFGDRGRKRAAGGLA